MSANEITCELVDEGDLDTRYIAGRLSQEEAEAFEAHFFGCEPCWGLVQQGLAVQSALGAGAGTPPLSSARSLPKTTRGGWWGLAAAASIAITAAGIWRLGYTPATNPAAPVFRGTTAPFTVAATAAKAALTASWPRVADADLYRVRLYAADGMLLLQRETADTLVSVSVDSVHAPRGSEIFWQVQALDRLRNAMSRSDLTPVVLPEP